MTNSFFRRFLKKIAVFALTFGFVAGLLSLGVFIGWKTEGFTSVYSAYSRVAQTSGIRSSGGVPGNLTPGSTGNAAEIVLFLSLLISILASWTIYLLVKTRLSKRAIADSERILELEIERQRSTSSKLDQTHQRLVETTGQLGGILEGTSDHIAAVDKELCYISFNQAYKENIRKLFRREISNGMSVFDALIRYPKKRDLAVGMWHKALSGEKFSAEQQFTDEEGSTFYYELTYTPILDEKGTVYGAAQISRDVTERRQTEERLRQEMEFVSAAIDVNSSLVIVLDLDGRIIRFNQACENVSGYKFEEVKGRIFWNILIPTEDLNKIKATYRNFYSTFFSEDYVNQWITKDEEIKLISWQVSAIKDDQGNIGYIVGTGIDITEKREFETARNRMMRILENSPDFISIYDFQGRVTYLNPAGRRMLGIEDDADISEIRTSSFHPSWVNELLQKKAVPVAVKKGSWLATTAIKTPDEREIPTSQLVLAHQNQKGKIEYFSTVIRDISAQKEMENSLAEARDNALKVIRSKSEFLANMSHEIRTPMSGVIGISELLLDTELDEEQKDYAETIQKCGESLLTIINDILDFSKLEAGKLQLEEKDFDLANTVDSVVELFIQSISQKGLELSVLLAPDVPAFVRGDAGRLRQVLTNLISNAVKFTDEGEIVLRVGPDPDKSDARIRFSVSDTGIGIEEDAQKELFHPYSQVSTTTSRDHGGTGLGLAICKQIMDMTGGDIGLESSYGNGSKFWFSAPLEAVERPEDKPETAIFRDKRVLVVDDNETNRRILVHQAKSWGAIADEAGNAQVALTMLRVAARNGEYFQAAVIDLDMPDHDGLELAEAIMKDPRLRRTEIILMPKASDRERAQKARSAGVELFLSKPLRVTDFNRTLTSALKNEETRHGSADSTEGDGLDVDYESVERAVNSANERQGRESWRILIAEDNLVNQKVIYNQVRRLGYKVDLVENGDEALKALERRRYALILMDCEMPVMDGFDATRLIRENESPDRERIPIIAVTAHAIEGDREKCFEAGMDDYMSKPTRQLVLRETISKWIDPHTGDTALQEETAAVSSNEGAPASSDTGSIDERLSELDDVCGTRVVLECIDLFLVDTTNAIYNLAAAATEGNFDRIAVEAHKLKGSSANMGAATLPRICQDLMNSARAGEERECARFVDLAVAEFEHLKDLYRTKRNKLERPSQRELTHA